MKISLVFLLVLLPPILYATEKKTATYDFPDGTDLIPERIRSSFECKSDGYYADQENNCQMFHVCHSIINTDGTSLMLQWPFFCNNQTIFDQFSFTCAYPEDSIPCERAADFFYLNAFIGVVPSVPFHNEMDVIQAEIVRGQAKFAIPVLKAGVPFKEFRKKSEKMESGKARINGGSVSEIYGGGAQGRGPVEVGAGFEGFKAGAEDGGHRRIGGSGGHGRGGGGGAGAVGYRGVPNGRRGMSGETVDTERQGIGASRRGHGNGAGFEGFRAGAEDGGHRRIGGSGGHGRGGGEVVGYRGVTNGRRGMSGETVDTERQGIGASTRGHRSGAGFGGFRVGAPDGGHRRVDGSGGQWPSLVPPRLGPPPIADRTRGSGHDTRPPPTPGKPILSYTENSTGAGFEGFGAGAEDGGHRRIGGSNGHGRGGGGEGVVGYRGVTNGRRGMSGETIDTERQGIGASTRGHRSGAVFGGFRAGAPDGGHRRVDGSVGHWPSLVPPPRLGPPPIADRTRGSGHDTRPPPTPGKPILSPTENSIGAGFEGFREGAVDYEHRRLDETGGQGREGVKGYSWPLSNGPNLRPPAPPGSLPRIPMGLSNGRSNRHPTTPRRPKITTTENPTHIMSNIKGR